MAERNALGGVKKILLTAQHQKRMKEAVVKADAERFPEPAKDWRENPNDKEGKS